MAKNVYTKFRSEGGAEMEKDSTFFLTEQQRKWMEKDTEILKAAVKGIAEMNEM